jgi:predicted dehydrogenase
VTHCYEIDEAVAAYQLIEQRADPYLAVQLTYPKPVADVPALPKRVTSAVDPAPGTSSSGSSPPAMISPAIPAPRLPLTSVPSVSPSTGGLAPVGSLSSEPPASSVPSAGSQAGIGWIGAGAFSTGTLLPAFRRAGFKRFVAVTSAGGITARRAADRYHFDKAVSGTFPVIDDPDVGIVVIATPHDTHAELAALALKDGRHVWCEKPVALSTDELAQVEAAWEASERQLMIGFNRRWSPAVRSARAALVGMATPKFLVYRVAAGPVAEGHWYTDRRQGGRILGEVCHFVDAAQALIGADIEETVSVLAGDGHGRGGGDGRIVPGNDAIVSLRFVDGSLATICYGSALPKAGKEWVEVTSGTHRLVIDDFRSLKLDGRTLWRGRQDKGHRAAAASFRRAVTGGKPLPTRVMLATMRATIQAASGAEHHD